MLELRLPSVHCHWSIARSVYHLIAPSDWTRSELCQHRSDRHCWIAYWCLSLAVRGCGCRPAARNLARDACGGREVYFAWRRGGVAAYRSRGWTTKLKPSHCLYERTWWCIVDSLVFVDWESSKGSDIWGGQATGRWKRTRLSGVRRLRSTAELAHAHTGLQPLGLRCQVSQVTTLSGMSPDMRKGAGTQVDGLLKPGGRGVGER